MICNLKLLGLALAATFVFSAVVASAAFAQNGRLTSDGPVTLEGTLTGTLLENSFTAFGNQVVCPGSTYTGHKFNTTPHESSIPVPASTMTITPHYKNCETIVMGTKFPTTIDMNGCDFEFDIKGQVIKDNYAVKVTEECPDTETIKVTVFGSVDDHKDNKPFCVIDITKQTSRTETVVASNPLNGTINITGTITDIVAHRESPTGSLLCMKKTESAGSMHIDVNVAGYDEVEEPTAISLSSGA